MLINLFIFLMIDLIIGSSSELFSSSLKTTKIKLNCDIRPFNDLHLLNYFLKQQLKQNPIPNEDLTRKFYDFRDQIDLNQLEADCEKRSKTKFALIKRKNKNQYDFEPSNKRSQKNRKEISQRMSLELVNALLLGKILGLNLGMISSVIFKNAFKPKGSNENGENGGGSGSASTPAPSGGESGGSSGGGDGGGGDGGGGGGDNGRYSQNNERFDGNYDEDNYSSRFNDQEEYCDESPIEASSSQNDYNDQSDWRSKRQDYRKRRTKRDLFNDRHKSSIMKHFLSSIEDNEDLIGASIYIPTVNRFSKPELTAATTIHRLDDHSSSNYKRQQQKQENDYHSYTFQPFQNENKPFLAPSFTLSQIPSIFHKSKTHEPSITSLIRSRNKSTFDSHSNEQTNNPRLPNIYSMNYDNFNLDSLATDNSDYSDEFSNRKEEIDLEHKKKISNEPQYFDDEFEDESFMNDRKGLDENLERAFKTEEFKRNFERNFDKNFNPKKSTSKQTKRMNNKKETIKNRKMNGPTLKKKIDFSQLEREDDLENDERNLNENRQDKKEQKLVRITRQITVYNKNLFEDKFDVRNVKNEEENLLDEQLMKEDLMEKDNANMIDLKTSDENSKKIDLLSKLKKKTLRKKFRKKKSPNSRKKRIRKKIKNKSKNHDNETAKRGGHRSRKQNLIS